MRDTIGELLAHGDASADDVVHQSSQVPCNDHFIAISVRRGAVRLIDGTLPDFVVSCTYKQCVSVVAATQLAFFRAVDDDAVSGAHTRSAGGPAAPCRAWHTSW